MKEATQNKINALVKQYKDIFNNEYLLCTEQVKRKRDNQLLDTGDMSKTSDLVERPLLEYPETLLKIFIMKLTTDEMKEFDTKNGSRWFARKYPEFCLVKKV